MNYYEVKNLLEGYVEYLSFMYGNSTIELRRNKKLNQFEYWGLFYTSVATKFLFMEFEMGDIKECCIVRVHYVYWKDKFLEECQIEQLKVSHHAQFLKDFTVYIYSMEEFQKLFNILERIDYFKQWD